MNPRLCIYEDDQYPNLYPLSLTRPVFELRCGIFTLLEKIVRHFPGYPVSYVVRRDLQKLMKERHPETPVNQLRAEDTFFINGRFIIHTEIPRDLSSSRVFEYDGRIVGAFVLAKDVEKIRLSDDGTLVEDSLMDFAPLKVNGTLVHYPWNLVHLNADQIQQDFTLLGSGGHILGKVYPNVTLLDQANIYLAPGAKLYPGVVVDGEAGPVYISEGATVMANAVIEGPVYIGRNTRIKIGAKIYGGTSLGDVCKVGGEVEGSIIHGYSNKQHEGFLGHAYLGEWVNLGADTNNSDLKNNYGSVKVMLGGKPVDTGSMFVGLFMGDHSKSGINTMFNTGSVVGVMCNVFGAGYTPKFIRSFTWGGIETAERYDFNKAIDTAKRVMQRRDKTLSDTEIELYQSIFDRSQHEPI